VPSLQLRAGPLRAAWAYGVFREAPASVSHASLSVPACGVSAQSRARIRNVFYPLPFFQKAYWHFPIPTIFIHGFVSTSSFLNQAYMNPTWRVNDTLESDIVSHLPEAQVALCESETGKGFIILDMNQKSLWLSPRFCSYLYGDATFRPSNKSELPAPILKLIHHIPLANSEFGTTHLFGEFVHWKRIQANRFGAFIINQVRPTDPPVIPHIDWKSIISTSELTYWKYFPEQDRLDEIWKCSMKGMGLTCWTEYFDPSERETVTAEMNATIRSGHSMQFISLARNGAQGINRLECYAEVTTAPGQQPCIVGYVKPIPTDLNAASKRNLQLENLLNLNNQVQGGLSQYLIRKNGSRKWLYLSSGIRDIYELDLEIIFNDSFHLESLVHPDDVVSLVARVKESMKSLQPFQTRHRLKFPDGRIKWISLHSTPERLPDGDLLWHAYHQDITEQYKTSEQVQEHHRELLSLSANIPGGIFILEIPHNKPAIFRFVSQQVEALYNQNPGEVYLHPRKILHQIAAEDRKRLLKTLLQAREDLEAFEFQYRYGADGSSERWHRVKARPRRSATGVTFFYGYFEDVTQIRMHENQLRDLVQLTSDQNKRLLDFAYMVSHNLRAHSSNMQGILDLWAEESSIETGDPYLPLLQKSLGKLNSTLVHLDQIVSLKNNVSSLIQRINLKSEIERVFEILHMKGGSENAKLEHYVPAYVYLAAVPAYLESILLNLVSNGIKYAHPNRAPNISVHYYEDPSGYRVEVKDNGIGIDLEKHQNKLFGLYQTFHMHPDARGMGLFLVRSHMHAMGGEVSCQSTPGQGSTFRLHFPPDKT